MQTLEPLFCQSQDVILCTLPFEKLKFIAYSISLFEYSISVKAIEWNFVRNNAKVQVVGKFADDCSFVNYADRTQQTERIWQSLLQRHGQRFEAKPVLKVSEANAA